MEWIPCVHPEKVFQNWKWGNYASRARPVDTLSDYSILFSVHFLYYCLNISSKDSHIEVFICTLKNPIYLNTDTFATINNKLSPRRRKSKRLSPSHFLKSSSLSKHCQQNLFYFTRYPPFRPLSQPNFASTPLRDHTKDFSNFVTSSFISCSLIFGLKRSRLSAARLPWVVARIKIPSSLQVRSYWVIIVPQKWTSVQVGAGSDIPGPNSAIEVKKQRVAK